MVLNVFSLAEPGDGSVPAQSKTFAFTDKGFVEMGLAGPTRQ